MTCHRTHHSGLSAVFGAVFLFFCVVGLFCLSQPVFSWAEDRPVSWRGRVVWVVDGDSVKVERSGKRVMIRLQGVDAPEYSQPWGRQAKTFTHRMVFGKNVTVLEKEKDGHGRTVATLLLPDGRSLNRLLLRHGLAWWYRRYSQDQDLGALEAEARDARHGLWSDAQPESPWRWRRTHARH